MLLLKKLTDQHFAENLVKGKIVSPRVSRALFNFTLKINRLKKDVSVNVFSLNLIFLDRKKCVYYTTFINFSYENIV